MPFFLISNLSVSQEASLFLSGNLPLGPKVSHCGTSRWGGACGTYTGQTLLEVFCYQEDVAALINDMKKKHNVASYFPLIKSTFITGLVLLRIQKEQSCVVESEAISASSSSRWYL